MSVLGKRQANMDYPMKHATAAISRRFGNGRVGRGPVFRRGRMGRSQPNANAGGAINTIFYQGRGQRGPRYMPPNRKHRNIFSSTNAGNTGSTTLLNGIAEGSDDFQRIGKRVHIRWVELKFWCTAANNDILKLSLVLDKQPNGTGTTASDIYDLTFGSNLALALRSTNTAFRYQVLKTDQMTICGGNSVDVAQVNWFVPCNFYMDFNGTGSAISDINTNALYFVVGNQATGLAVPYDVSIRTSFSDV